MSNFDDFRLTTDTEQSGNKTLISSKSTPSSTETSSFFSLKTWSLKWILISVSCLIVVIMIPIIFTVIIPSIIISSCEDSDITIQKATFIHPSDTTFSTSINLKFSTGISLSSNVDIHKMKISWLEPGGGYVMKLTNVNDLQVTTSSQTMKASVSVTNLTALTNFASSIMTLDTFNLNMKGDATVTVIVPTDVTLKKKSGLFGFSNWTNGAKIPTLNITNGTNQYLQTIAISELSSSSNVEIIFGQNVYYKLKVYGNVFVGLGKFSNFTLFTGNFTDISTVNLYYTNPTEYNGLMYLIGNYMSRIDTPVIVNEMYLENTVEWLKPALNSIEINAIIPGLTTELILYVDMYVSVKNPLKVPFTLTLYNPLVVPVTLDTMNADIYYKGLKIATVAASNLKIVVPALGNTTSQEIQSQVDPKYTNVVLDLLNAGYGLIDCYSIITIYIVEFEAKVNYFQNNISAYIHPPRS